MRYATAFLLALFCLAGCQSSAGNEAEAELGMPEIADDNLDVAAKNYMRYVANGGRYVHPTLEYAYMRQHRNQITESFEVVRRDTLHDYASVLARYSIDGTIYRVGFEFGRNDGPWHIVNPYLSDEEKGQLPAAVRQRYEEIDERRSQWVRNDNTMVEDLDLFR